MLRFCLHGGCVPPVSKLLTASGLSRSMTKISALPQTQATNFSSSNWMMQRVSKFSR